MKAIIIAFAILGLISEPTEGSIQSIIIKIICGIIILSAKKKVPQSVNKELDKLIK